MCAKIELHEANTLEHISAADGENINAKRVGLYAYDYTNSVWRRFGIDASGFIKPSVTTTPVTTQYKVTASAVQMASNALTNGVIITAKSTNAANVFIGTSSGVTTTADGTGNGTILEPGASLSWAVDNTNRFWVIGTANDVLSFSGS